MRPIRAGQGGALSSLYRPLWPCSCLSWDTLGTLAARRSGAARHHKIDNFSNARGMPILGRKALAGRSRRSGLFGEGEECEALSVINGKEVTKTWRLPRTVTRWTVKRKLASSGLIRG
jgi:hypothetical protein